MKNTSKAKLNLSDFATMCMSVCEKWFDIKLPFAKSVENDLIDLITDKILGNGLFVLMMKTAKKSHTSYSQ